MEQTTETINKTAVITEEFRPEIYQDSELNAVLDVSLPLYSEIKLVSVLQNNSVKVVLPNNSTGFISGDEEVAVVQSAWATDDILVYDEMNDSAKTTAISKGQEIEILCLVGDGWARIRLRGQEDSARCLFLKQSEEEVLTEESVSEFIGSEIAEGKNKKEIVNSLVEQGMNNDQAKLLADKTDGEIKDYLSSPEGKKDMKKANLKRMFFGLLWCIGGFVATAISMDSASAGGTYYLFYGAVLYGVWDILVGLFGWIKNSL